MSFTTLTPVAVGQKFSAALFNTTITAIQELQTAASQLQGANTQFIYTPASAQNTATTAGAQLWVSVGTISVPSWANQALVSLTVNGVFAATAGTNSTQCQLRIGSAAGSTRRLVPDPGAPTRFMYAINDVVSGVSAGVQTVRLYSTWVAGSTYTADTFTVISGLVTFSL